MTLRGLARALDVNPSHIHRLIGRGVVVVGEDKLIDLASARAAIEAAKSISHGYMDAVNSAQRARPRAASATRTPRPATHSGTPDLPAAAGDGAAAASAATTRMQRDRAEFDSLRIRRERAAVQREELKLQVDSKALVPRATAEKVLFELARNARDGWLGFPSRVAPLIAAKLGLQDAGPLLQALTSYVHEQLQALGDKADFTAADDA